MECLQSLACFRKLQLACETHYIHRFSVLNYIFRANNRPSLESPIKFQSMKSVWNGGCTLFLIIETIYINWNHVRYVMFIILLSMRLIFANFDVFINPHKSYVTISISNCYDIGHFYDHSKSVALIRNSQSPWPASVDTLPVATLPSSPSGDRVTLHTEVWGYQVPSWSMTEKHVLESPMSL